MRWGSCWQSLCNILLFDRFGWRPLFFLGGLPAMLAIFVRMRVKESEVWQKTRHEELGRSWAAPSSPTGSRFSISCSS